MSVALVTSANKFCDDLASELAGVWTNGGRVVTGLDVDCFVTNGGVVSVLQPNTSRLVLIRSHNATLKCFAGHVALLEVIKGKRLQGFTVIDFWEGADRC
jgi:hypothetical protein